MTEEEYSSENKRIQEEFNNSIDELNKRYVDENCPYKIGDIIEDHIGRLKIENIYYIFDWDKKLPSCYFTGIELCKKDNMPKKKQDYYRKAYWRNIIQKIN